MPLKQQEHVVSWNSMILNGSDSTPVEIHLPEISRVTRQSTSLFFKCLLIHSRNVFE